MLNSALKLLSIVFFALCLSTNAVANDSVQRAIDAVKELCLVGSQYTLKLEASGKLVISKLLPGGESKIIIDAREASGATGYIDDKMRLLADKDIRECIEPHISKIVDRILDSKPESKMDIPKPKLVADEFYNFVIKNVGGPMINYEEEIIGIIAVEGSRCDRDYPATNRPEYFEYPDIGTSKAYRGNSLDYASLDFGEYFNKSEKWFRLLQKKVGQVGKNCLMGFRLENYIQIKFDDLQGQNHRRYYSVTAHKMDYVIGQWITTETDEPSESLCDPKEWREMKNYAKKAPTIDKISVVTAEHVKSAHSYLKRYEWPE